MKENISPTQLIIRLSVYFAILFAALIVLIVIDSAAMRYLPFGGVDALEVPGIEITETSVSVDRQGFARYAQIQASPENIGSIILFLATTLLATIVVTVPLTWTYTATRFDAGPSKAFVRALLLLPICATTVVLLIQDSLALAFGLAALVAAVRFRVEIPETIDGIYIFAAICIGLAAGVGYMGIALVMVVIFTITNAILWRIDYGRNPIDDARRRAKEAKLAAKL